MARPSSNSCTAYALRNYSQERCVECLGNWS